MASRFRNGERDDPVEQIHHRLGQPLFRHFGNFLYHHNLWVMTLTMLETVHVIGTIAWTKQLPMTMRIIFHIMQKPRIADWNCIRLCKSMQRNKIQQSLLKGSERRLSHILHSLIWIHLWMSSSPPSSPTAPRYNFKLTLEDFDAAFRPWPWPWRAHDGIAWPRLSFMTLLSRALAAGDLDPGLTTGIHFKVTLNLDIPWPSMA